MTEARGRRAARGAGRGRGRRGGGDGRRRRHGRPRPPARWRAAPWRWRPCRAGNANVFARATGWPARPRTGPRRCWAARSAPGPCATRRSGRLRRRRARPRVFAINAGVGLDAATVEWIEARPRTKRRLRQAGLRPRGGRGHGRRAAGARRACRWRSTAAPAVRRSPCPGGLRHALHLPRPAAPGPGPRRRLRRAASPGWRSRRARPTSSARPRGPARRAGRPLPVEAGASAGRAGAPGLVCAAERRPRCRPTARRWGTTSFSRLAPDRCCGSSIPGAGEHPAPNSSSGGRRRHRTQRSMRIRHTAEQGGSR